MRNYCNYKSNTVAVLRRQYPYINDISNELRPAIVTSRVALLHGDGQVIASIRSPNRVKAKKVKISQSRDISMRREKCLGLNQSN